MKTDVTFFDVLNWAINTATPDERKSAVVVLEAVQSADHARRTVEMAKFEAPPTTGVITAPAAPRAYSARAEAHVAPYKPAKTSRVWWAALRKAKAPMTSAELAKAIGKPEKSSDISNALGLRFKTGHVTRTGKPGAYAYQVIPPL